MRPAADSDLVAVVALLAAVAAEDRWIATEVPFDRERRRARMLESLLRDDTIMLVAHEGDTLIGNLSMSPRRRGLFEFGMIVAEPWRGAGVGSALLGASIARARDARAHKIALEVFPGNVAAIALYRKFGFVEEGFLRRHLRRNNGELWDVITMGLLLDGAGRAV